MFKPGTDETNVQMTDVLCDFCHRGWTEEVPFIEGHRGAIICGNCLRLAHGELVTHGGGASSGYDCRLCREGDEDRATLERTGETGWQSPIDEEAAACRRCIEQAFGALRKDPDWADGMG